MQFAILDALEGAGNGKPKCARGVKRNSSGVKQWVKYFLERVKENLGEFNPPPLTSAHEVGLRIYLSGIFWREII